MVPGFLLAKVVEKRALFSSSFSPSFGWEEEMNRGEDLGNGFTLLQVWQEIGSGSVLPLKLLYLVCPFLSPFAFSPPTRGGRVGGDVGRLMALGHLSVVSFLSPL